jgi:hypothetical protein
VEKASIGRYDVDTDGKTKTEQVEKKALVVGGEHDDEGDEGDYKKDGADEDMKVGVDEEGV